MKIELISITPNAELVIEEAGRTCYKSKVGNPSVIRKWIDSKHESVLEHASVTFRISGVSRSFTHQLVRHRIGFSYSQESQRYVKQDQFEYVTPQKIRDNDSLNKEYVELMESIQSFYSKAIANIIKPEDARFVLPNACTTEIVVTMNFRAVRNFLTLRLDSHAQWEIREVAFLILREMKNHAPNVFYDFEDKI